jgi:hypothetical protein
MNVLNKYTQNMLPFNIWEVKKFARELNDPDLIEWVNIEGKGPFIERVNFSKDYFPAHIWKQYQALLAEFAGKLEALAIEHEKQLKQLGISTKLGSENLPNSKVTP